MKKVIVIVVVVLVLLIFLSGTIYNFNRPTVTAVMPARGNLQHTELTTGIAYVYYADESVMYSVLDGMVTSVLVREGDTVYIGQPLIEMGFREADIHEQIDAVHANFHEQSENLRLAGSRIQLEIERIDTNIRNIEQRQIGELCVVERQIDELRGQNFRAETISDFEIRQTEISMHHAETHLERTRLLYNAGVVARMELFYAENNLEELRHLHENLLVLYAKSIERRDEMLANLEQYRDSQIHNLQHQLDLLRLERRTWGIEMEALTLQRSILERERDTQLLRYERQLYYHNRNAVLTSPVNGVIISLHVVQGQNIGISQRLIAFGLNGEYIVESTVPLSRDFIRIGSTATLYNSTHVLEGTVTQVRHEQNAQRITLAVLSGEINSGETFIVRFEETSDVSFILVPNGAVNRDNDGYFLNQIRRRQGILGTEFYTIRQDIFIGGSDSTHTAVIRGIQTFEPIAVLSDRPFTHGQTIRLQNEGDLFVR